MVQIKIGHFESDAGIVHIPIGFMPDYVRLVAKGASSTNAIVYEWFREMQDHDSIDGWSFSDGVDAEVASGSGITEYDTATAVPTIEEWTNTRSDNATARSATARGTLIKATVDGVDADGNRMDTSAIFECVTDGDGGATEPAWPRVVGEQVTDGTTVWERVNEPLRTAGYQGFSLAASMTGLADSDEGYYLAIGTGGNVEDHGDVASWPSGIYGG